eukprot:6182070-Pleurochrysis_carterae.AAC.3
MAFSIQHARSGHECSLFYGTTLYPVQKLFLRLNISSSAIPSSVSERQLFLYLSPPGIPLRLSVTVLRLQVSTCRVCAGY